MLIIWNAAHSTPQNYGDELPAKGVLYPVPRNLYTPAQLELIERFLTGPGHNAVKQGGGAQQQKPVSLAAGRAC